MNSKNTIHHALHAYMHVGWVRRYRQAHSGRQCTSTMSMIHDATNVTQSTIHHIHELQMSAQDSEPKLHIDIKSNKSKIQPQKYQK